MKYLCLIACFFVIQCSSNVSAQVGTIAPNFTAVDVHGNTHDLYSYLEEGKTVVLDFFYTTCGPCQYYAPQVNLVYEKYGCNTQDVFFLSIDFDDTDAQVIAYEEEHEIMYPSISGIEGNGNDIVQAYAINSFPRFYVIDSTKTIRVQVDPPTVVRFDYEFDLLGITPSACATSIEDTYDVEDMHLFPNPMLDTDVLSFQIGDLSNRCELKMYDVTGNTVLIRELDIDEIAKQQITLQDLSQGIYFVEIKDIDRSKVFRSKLSKL